MRRAGALSALAPLMATIVLGSRIAFPRHGVDLSAFVPGAHLAPPMAWEPSRALPALPIGSRPGPGGGARLPRPLRASGSLFVDVESLRPLLNEVDDRVRCVLLVWAFVDNVLKALQIAVSMKSDRVVQKVLGAHGADIYALEAMKDILAQTNIDEGGGSAEARRLQQEGIRELEARIDDRVDEAAEYALGLSGDLFPPRQGTKDGEVVVRITDEEIIYTTGGISAPGKFVDLSGDSLRAAADLDVSAELGLRPGSSAPRIRLLGLVVAVSHDRIFRAVMEKLHGEDAPQSLQSFVREQEAANVADLVMKLLKKYQMPAPLSRARTALYSMTELRDDPTYFQVAWGFRLAARVVNRGVAAIPGRVHRASEIVLRATPLVEVYMRSGALINMLTAAILQPVVSPRDHLKVVTTFLTVALICHNQARSSKLFARLADKAMNRARLLFGRPLNQAANDIASSG